MLWHNTRLNSAMITSTSTCVVSDATLSMHAKHSFLHISVVAFVTSSARDFVIAVCDHTFNTVIMHSMIVI